MACQLSLVMDRFVRSDVLVIRRRYFMHSTSPIMERSALHHLNQEYLQMIRLFFARWTATNLCSSVRFGARPAEATGQRKKIEGESHAPNTFVVHMEKLEMTPNTTLQVHEHNVAGSCRSSTSMAMGKWWKAISFWHSMRCSCLGLSSTSSIVLSVYLDGCGAWLSSVQHVSERRQLRGYHYCVDIISTCIYAAIYHRSRTAHALRTECHQPGIQSYAMQNLARLID